MPTHPIIAVTTEGSRLWASDEQSDALTYMERVEAVAQEIEDVGNWTGDVVEHASEWHVVMDYAGCGNARRVLLEDWKAEALRRLDEVRAELLKL